jgi:hypothetical protein
MQDGYIFNMKKTRPPDVLYERGGRNFLNRKISAVTTILFVPTVPETVVFLPQFFPLFVLWDPWLNTQVFTPLLSNLAGYSKFKLAFLFRHCFFEGTVSLDFCLWFFHRATSFGTNRHA